MDIFISRRYRPRPAFVGGSGRGTWVPLFMKSMMPAELSLCVGLRLQVFS
jgi:hypothetical protein